MGRKPLAISLRKRQINIAINPGIRARLEQEAIKHDVTLAEEIRMRLEVSLGYGLMDRQWFDYLRCA